MGWGGGRRDRAAGDGEILLIRGVILRLGPPRRRLCRSFIMRRRGGGGGWDWGGGGRERGWQKKGADSRMMRIATFFFGNHTQSVKVGVLVPGKAGGIHW